MPPLTHGAAMRLALARAGAGPKRNKTYAHRASSHYSARPPRRGGRMAFVFLSTAAVCGAAFWAYPFVFKDDQAAVPRADLEFEKKRKTAVSKEENRDLISSQHLQVKKSWEHPGVYAWGSNAGRVVAPDSSETMVKTPRRISYFDGQILRDLKMDKDFGVAVTEGGDLVQWGTGFSTSDTAPVTTLRGKDIKKVAVSRDRIIALSSGGSVYSMPVSQVDQKSGAKQQQSSWLSFWTSPSSSVNYRSIQPPKLNWGERVVDVSSGLEHCLLLTSHGRVFSAASSTESFPSRGQLGVPGLTWLTRPHGPYDMPHEISILRGFKIASIATGDFHSLVLDEEGRVFSFGDNSAGQLGFPVDTEFPLVDAPSLLPFAKAYSGSNLLPKATSVAAGGANSYFTIEATKIVGQGLVDDKTTPRDLGRIVADTWACGEGKGGSLGNGKWTHISAGPTKIKSLSNLFEYDETTQKVIPIRLAKLVVGSTHASAIMDNVTHLDASHRGSENETNWGADIVWWGGNEFYQLGTGKRNNVNEPTYISPLDGGEGDAAKGRKGEAHRFQITPRTTVRIGEKGKERKVSMEQRVECGRYVTAVYSGI